ncbi:MAG: LruC domain-containing protein [Spirochaetales bacterium]|nr:LruC domain-containing protein [Spirochaetales bacterium]
MKFKTLLFPLLTVSLLMFSLSGCSLWITDEIPDYFQITDMDELEVDESFDYRTTRLVSVSLDYGSEYASVPVLLFGTTDDDPDNRSPEDEARSLLGKIVLDSSGTFTGDVSVPFVFKHIESVPLYLGLPSKLIPINTMEAASVEYTARAGKELNASLLSRSAGSSTAASDETASRSIDSRSYEENGFRYVLPFSSNSDWAAYGLPEGMESVDVSSDLLENINASLPEYQSVPEAHPEFLEDEDNVTNLSLTEEANVAVTFIHEGASYTNALAFLAYPEEVVPDSDSAPGMQDDLDGDDVNDMSIIFPNASFAYSGGMLETGDTVDLGNFPAGTVLYWALIANSWSNSRGENDEKGIYFSNPEWNPESDPSKKQHTVLLKDLSGDDEVTFVVGFEDLNRSYGGDNDFNDLVFLVTVDPVSAIKGIDSIKETLGSSDTDGDGVPDAQDEFPNNPELTAETVHEGFIAFEDQWPAKGDYDFNDLAARCRYTLRTDANNYVRSFIYDIEVQALGAGNKNGLYLKLPVQRSDLLDAGGSLKQSDEYDYDDPEIVSDGSLSAVSDGTVVKLFENANDAVFDIGETIINTDPGEAFIDPSPVTGSLYLDADASVTLSDLGDHPYDLFLLQNGNETHEIHLPNMPPSGIEDQPLLGTAADDSNGIDRFYLTKNNLPWVLYLPGDWDYPVEVADITETYNHFAEWAMTGGRERSDWYLDKEGYRNEENIYSKD